MNGTSAGLPVSTEMPGGNNEAYLSVCKTRRGSEDLALVDSMSTRKSAGL